MSYLYILRHLSINGLSLIIGCYAMHLTYCRHRDVDETNRALVSFQPPILVSPGVNRNPAQRIRVEGSRRRVPSKQLNTPAKQTKNEVPRLCKKSLSPPICEEAPFLLVTGTIRRLREFVEDGFPPSKSYKIREYLHCAPISATFGLQGVTSRYLATKAGRNGVQTVVLKPITTNVAQQVHHPARYSFSIGNFITAAEFACTEKGAGFGGEGEEEAPGEEHVFKRVYYICEFPKVVPRTGSIASNIEPFSDQKACKCLEPKIANRQQEGLYCGGWRSTSATPGKQNPIVTTIRNKSGAYRVNTGPGYPW
ncbi:hypothetical protein BDD12DRAFT_927980 [Trichophaea hybrida]|nr:hypothetical protein BDD12DRAFT_927980 [Trichophaea hybrida]